jgi:hypothetical protein
MNAKELEEVYGSEYPIAVTMFDVRLAEIKERRFTRIYSNEEHKYSTIVSRFEDGSASISLEELETDWSSWPDGDRNDFCSACSALHEHPDFPDMLRFVMGHGNHLQWSLVANLVSYALPADEAFAVLTSALERTPSHESNLIQAIALTKHQEAAPFLRHRLSNLWSRSELWADDSFLNWTAYDATCCISHLLELGEKPADYEEMARALSSHVCAGNRDSCVQYLHQCYEWIPALQPWQPPGSPKPSL